MTKKCKLLICFFITIASTSILADISPSKKESVKIGIYDKGSKSTMAISFIPPDEDGWKKTHNGLDVSLKKEGKLPGESREIEAYMMTPEMPISPISGYIKGIKKNLKEGITSEKRFNIAILDVTEDPKNKQCARIHLLLEDTQQSKASNTQQKKWSEQYALSCGSLKQNSIGFEVRYYHRYFDSQKDPEFESQANKVLDSVIIQDE